MLKKYLLIATALVLFVGSSCENKDENTNINIENEKPGRPLSRELIKGVRLGASQEEWEKNVPYKDRVTKLKWKGKEYEFSYYADKDYENGEICRLSLTNSQNSINIETIADIYSQKYVVMPLDTDIGRLQAELLFTVKKGIESGCYEDDNLSRSYAVGQILSTYIFFYDSEEDILIVLRSTPKEYQNESNVVNIAYQYKHDWVLKTQESIESNKRHLELFLYNKRNEEINEIGEF